MTMWCATPYIGEDGIDWPPPAQLKPKPTMLEEAHAIARLSWAFTTPERPYEHMSLDHLSVLSCDIEKSLLEARADNDIMEITHFGAVLDQLMEETARRVF
jgi:hypothetical protein